MSGIILFITAGNFILPNLGLALAQEMAKNKTKWPPKALPSWGCDTMLDLGAYYKFVAIFYVSFDGIPLISIHSQIF
jgi:hypothetical protein